MNKPQHAVCTRRDDHARTLLADAKQAVADKVSFDGKQMRRDIALRAVEGEQRDAA